MTTKKIWQKSRCLSLHWWSATSAHRNGNHGKNAPSVNYSEKEEDNERQRTEAETQFTNTSVQLSETNRGRNETKALVRLAKGSCYNRLTEHTAFFNIDVHIRREKTAAQVWSCSHLHTHQPGPSNGKRNERDGDCVQPCAGKMYVRAHIHASHSHLLCLVVRVRVRHNEQSTSSSVFCMCVCEHDWNRIDIDSSARQRPKLVAFQIMSRMSSKAVPHTKNSWHTIVVAIVLLWEA